MIDCQQVGILFPSLYIICQVEKYFLIIQNKAYIQLCRVYCMVFSLMSHLFTLCRAGLWLMVPPYLYWSPPMSPYRYVCQVREYLLCIMSCSYIYQIIITIFLSCHHTTCLFEIIWDTMEKAVHGLE